MQGHTLWLTDQWGATDKAHFVFDRVVIGPKSSQEKIILYKTEKIWINATGPGEPSLEIVAGSMEDDIPKIRLTQIVARLLQK